MAHGLMVVGVVAAAGLLLGGCKCNCNTAEKPGSEAKQVSDGPATTSASRDVQPVTDGQDPAGAAARTRVIPVNTMCPLGKHTFNATTRDPDTSRMYKGSIIGFCCEDCSEKFDTMSAAEKDQVLAAAKANKPM
jgi:hypothetical protein